MSETSEQSNEQTPEELAATLGALLDQTVSGDLRRRLEPEPSFAAERAWSVVKSRDAQ